MCVCVCCLCLWDMQHTEKNNINRDFVKLWVHCHRLLSSLALSSPSSPLTHVHAVNRGSYLRIFLVWHAIRKLNPNRAASHPAFLKAIIVHCSIYRPVSVCVCVCVCFPVWQLWNSSVKESARSQGGTRLHSHADMHLDLEGGAGGGTVPQTTITQNEISICSEVLEMRGNGDSRRGRGEGNWRWREVNTGIKLCGVFVRWYEQKSQTSSGGFGAQMKRTC